MILSAIIAILMGISALDVCALRTPQFYSYVVLYE